MATRLDAPAAWEIDTRPTAEGIALALTYRRGEGLETVHLALPREAARAFADQVLCAAGSAIHRTAPAGAPRLDSLTAATEAEHV